MQMERGAAGTRYAQAALVAAPPPPARFTFEEWRLSNNARSRIADDQRQLAERVLKECERVRQETRERAEQTRATSERKLEEWIGDVEFNKTELTNRRTEICRELEALAVYRTRLQDCLDALLNPLDICRKCILLREGRLGIDLVVDDVEKALQSELNTIIGGQNVLKRTLEQTVEQIRRLRATQYMVDRDLQYKQASIDIDRGSLNLRPSDGCLSIYEGYADLDPANITADEYNAYTAKNIQLAGQEMAGARLMRVYVDNVLKQVIDDLLEAYAKCNYAFQQRIADTKREKARLEETHSETAEKVMAMEKNILELRKALADKEAETALAHTRLGRRAQRQAVELVHDPPAQALLYECETLRCSTERLQQMLHEATASLRYLLQVQIQIEEDINVKMNTIKIDDVDCMTSRETMHYHYY